jgi:hypothetical protein
MTEELFQVAFPVLNFLLLVWLHVRIANSPGGSVNVRAILGAIQALRVQLDSHHEEDADSFAAIRAKCRHLIDLIDIYVLRVGGPTIEKPQE